MLHEALVKGQKNEPAFDEVHGYGLLSHGSLSVRSGAASREIELDVAVVEGELSARLRSKRFVSISHRHRC